MADDRSRIGNKRNRLLQLQVFCLVARFGSFTRAADHLGVGPSAVSLRVRELEGELEAYLFDRIGSGVSLTLAGERFLARVEPLVERMDSLFENFSGSVNDEVSGWLELATSAAGAANVLPPYAKQLRDLYPEVRLRVRKCAPDEALSMLLADEVELVLRGPGTATEPSLEYREILTYDIVLITPLDHPLAGRETVTLEEAARFPAVVPPAGSNSRRFGEEVVRQRGIRIPAVNRGGRMGCAEALRRKRVRGFGGAEHLHPRERQRVGHSIRGAVSELELRGIHATRRRPDSTCGTVASADDS